MKRRSAVTRAPSQPLPDGDETPRRRAPPHRRLIAPLAFFLLGFLVLAWMWKSRDVPPATSADKAPRLPRVPFRDITEEAGLGFTHVTGAFGEKLLPETMGGGCAVLDYDSDGDADVLLINSSDWPFDPRPLAPQRPTMGLYQNDGQGKFRDVTVGSGLDFSSYAMGVAIGDYDNDGDPDVFISAVGYNRLLRNDEGRFFDVTTAAGVAGPESAWSTSCGWFDYDGDGLLDLFVCNYVQWSRDIDLALESQIPGVGRAYGPPTAFAGTYSLLYRNEGDGTFRDVSREAGIQVNDFRGLPAGKSLGVTFADVNGDGDADIIVANDTVQNFYFENQGDGTFRERAGAVGIAVDRSGRPRGAMGIDVGYFRNSDELGVAIGNFANEMSALYVTGPDEPMFVDAAVASGFGPPTRLALTFGIFFFDVDLDGRLDILSANGHLEEQINRVFVGQHYEQPPQLFWNAGPGRGHEFVRVPEENVGAEFSRPLVGRGAVYADFDGDGDLDVLLTACGRRPRLLRNDQTLGHHWLRVKLIGRHCNRDAIGAIIDLHQPQGRQRRLLMPTCSYLSQTEPIATFGLGRSSQVEQLVVYWPDGSQQQVHAPAVDQVLTVQQQPVQQQPGL